MSNEIKYLQDRNTVIVGELERTRIELRDAHRRIRELELELARAIHPSSRTKGE
jgi:hypothetical protein